PLAVRLREPDLSLVLADPRPAHLSNNDLRAMQDPITRPGRGVLADSHGALPLQMTTAEGTLLTDERTPSGRPCWAVAANDSGRSRQIETTTGSTSAGSSAHHSSAPQEVTATANCNSCQVITGARPHRLPCQSPRTART